jgi:hypothetical protein
VNVLLEFIYLQFMDLLTTVAFLLYGVAELNPIVQWAMRVSPSALGGLVAVKVLAVLLALFCIARARHKLLRRVNVFFALIVAYNVLVLIIAAPVLQ